MCVCVWGWGGPIPVWSCSAEPYWLRRGEGLVPPNLEDDKWNLKETVNCSHFIKSPGRVNYKIYGGLIEWASGGRSGREAAGEPQTVVRWVAVTHRHSFSWDLFCVKDFAERLWFIPAAIKAQAVDKCWSPARRTRPLMRTLETSGQSEGNAASCFELRAEIFIDLQTPNALGHRWVTCFMNTNPFKRKRRSNNCSPRRHNAHDQGCETLQPQFGPPHFTGRHHAQILSRRRNWSTLLQVDS